MTICIINYKKNYNDNTNYDNQDVGYDYPRKPIYESLQTEVKEKLSEFENNNSKWNSTVSDCIEISISFHRNIVSSTTSNRRPTILWVEI